VRDAQVLHWVNLRLVGKPAQERIQLYRSALPYVKKSWAQIYLNKRIEEARREDRHLYVEMAIALQREPETRTGSSDVFDQIEEGADAVTGRFGKGSATEEFDVFLAHNSLDRRAVQHLRDALVARGVRPWLDTEEVPPGRWFQDVIQSVLPRVKAAAIVIGANGLGKWQELEVRAFLSQCVERGTPVIPILLPGVEHIPDNLPFLRELNYVAFVNGPRDEQALQKLVRGITGVRP